MDTSMLMAAPPGETLLVQGRPFSEEDYLAMNPDVRAAVASGGFASGREHFELLGINEGRIGCYPHGHGSEEFFGDEPVDVSSLGALRAEKFPYAGPHPWLDRPDALERIAEKEQTGELTPAEAEQCRHWVEHGYLILRNCVAPADLDHAWAEYEAAIAAGTVTLPPDKASPDDPWPGRLLDPHQKVPALCPLLRHPEILRWVKRLMEREPAPFQTIISHKGTQQAPHSDSIHMTTYPLGYLTAAWIAFEDIHPDSGPLEYYPGSHRLPYVFSREVGITEEEFRRIGYQSYIRSYEPYIGQLLREHGFTARHFVANKGDVLMWHANLIHGGSVRRDVRHSRRALVNHYFVRGAVTYHDLAAERARQHSSTCLLSDQRFAAAGA